MIIKDATKRGFDFIKENPQLLYTLFLVVVIPLAFIFTSEAFLSIAKKQNDLAEQNKVGFLHDSVGSYISSSEGTTTPEKLQTIIDDVSRKNSTLVGFYVIEGVRVDNVQTFNVIATLNANDVPLGVYTPDETTDILMRFALANPEYPLTRDYFKNTERTWKTITYFGSRNMYVVTDISMANSDATLAKNINNSYLVLLFVIILIILLLARHAKIVDYATLYKKLEEVDKMKDDFVSIAAHELRSPLTVIRGRLDMLKDMPNMTESSQHIISNIDDSAKDLNVLIGDILDVARLQEGRMSFNLVNISPKEILDEIFDQFNHVASAKNLKLIYQSIELPYINVDKTRFKQVMVNLVGNAIKYTKEGGVTVITKIVDDGKNLEIRVSDTGIGVSADAQKLLFSKFYRVKTEDTKNIIGTGLGLWITAEIVKKMNGTISVESIEGKGSDFIIKFKIAN